MRPPSPLLRIAAAANAMLLSLLAAPLLGPSDPMVDPVPARGTFRDSAYPPPPPPGPSPTPTPDADGLLPLPADLPQRRLPLAEAPAADLLQPLARALAAGDAASLAQRAGSARRPLLLFPWGPPEGEGVDALEGPADLRAGLDALLVDPTGRPKIQGLFHLPSPVDDGACATVLLHGFPADAAWPAPTPSALPPAGPPPAAGPLLPAVPRPLLLDADAAAWRFCRGAADADWHWDSWQAGPYYGLLQRLAERHPGTSYLGLRD